MLRYFRLHVRLWIVIGTAILSLKSFAKPENVLGMTYDPSLSFDEVNSEGHLEQIYEYNKAILSLGGKTETIEKKWIMAESLFHLQKTAKALPYYEQIALQSKDRREKERASFRIVESELLAGRVENAITHFKSFTKIYKDPPSRLAYALGKTLFDANDGRAQKFLAMVNAGEYFMRARYLVAVMNLSRVSKKATLKALEEVSKSKPVSMEDPWVKELALLAQARIYADAKDFTQAELIYESIAPTGAFYETAAAELIRVLLYQRELLLMGLDRFARLSKDDRQLLAKECLDKASQAIFRFSKGQKIDWRTPEMLSAMASLMSKARRYEDAKLAYDELIEHYRPLRKALLSLDSSQDLWSYFAIYPENARRSWILIDGIPPSLSSGLLEVKDIIALRDRIEASGKKLRDIEEEVIGKSAVLEVLEKARANQLALETAYRKMVIEKQAAIKKELAHRFGSFLAEAEYERADTVLAHMRDIEKQLDVVQEFNREANDQFNSELKEEGGGS